MLDREVQNELRSLVEEVAIFMDDEDRQNCELAGLLSDVQQVRTFEEAGVLTDNAGLVVSMGDGTEFQIDIVRSR